MKSLHQRSPASHAVRHAFLLRITIREFIRGQFLWMGVAAQVLLIMSVFFFSSIGLDDNARIFDQFAYFLTLTLALFVSSLIGSVTWKRDVAKTGLSEITCSRSFGPTHLFLTRSSTQALGVSVYLLILFALYVGSLWMTFPDRFAQTLPALPAMFGLGLIYTILALSVSLALGVFVRPPLAQFGTLLLFTAGTLSESLTQVASLGGPTAAEARTTWGRIALPIIQWWRPQALIIQAEGGQWQVGTTAELLLAASWGLMACGFFVSLGALGTRTMRGAQSSRWGQ
jgi:hypothetical protein